MMDTFSGRVAMVTGGATGIGAAISERLALLDAEVACCYNTSRTAAEALAQKLKEQGREILPLKMDVTNGREVKDGIEAINRHFGRPITILVNNAGDQVAHAPLETMAEELWDKVISLNLKGAFLCAQGCIPGMKAAKGGSIINVSSISARSGG